MLFSLRSADIVNFTDLSSTVQPAQVCDQKEQTRSDLVTSQSCMQMFAFLNELYRRYDAVVSQFNVYKVETIGDCELHARQDQFHNPSAMSARALSSLRLHVRDRPHQR